MRMRSWLAVFVVMILVSPSLLAQRGGGHGGGHAGGFTGSRGFGGGTGFSGGMGAGHGMSFPAPRVNFPSNFASAPRMAYPTRSFSSYPRTNYSMSGYPANRVPYGQVRSQGIKRGPYPGNGSSGRSRSRYPYRRPYFYASATYLTPGLLNYWPYFGDWGSSYDDSGSSYQDTSAEQTDAAQNEAYAPEAEQQTWGAPTYSSAPSAEPAPEPAVTLVFKDGHSIEIHNYAATSRTILLLDQASSGRTSQVSLDEIDLAATERVNREAGVDFNLPAAK